MGSASSPRGLTKQRRGMAGAARSGSALLGAALLSAACVTSPPLMLYTPYTGLRISSAALFAGYTCGLAPGQVYAYVAVVSDASDAGPQPAGLPIANTYSCQDNGAFQNLPGSGSYNVSIYAYDRDAFPAQLVCKPESCALPPTMASQLGNPTWTTTCFGVVEASQNELVLCQPLTPTAAAASPEAGTSPSPEAGAADATTTDAATGDAMTGDGALTDGAGAADGADGMGDGAVTTEGGDIDGGSADGADGADATEDADASDGT